LTGVDGTLPYDIAYFLQGKLRVPAGTAGLVVMPWMVWEVRGTGQVSIAGATYEIGSPDLRAAIQSPGRQIENIEIIESTTDLEFIFFVNAMRYGLIGSTTPQSLC
jgi:hypothetical protein